MLVFFLIFLLYRKVRGDDNLFSTKLENKSQGLKARLAQQQAADNKNVQVDETTPLL